MAVGKRMKWIVAVLVLLGVAAGAFVAGYAAREKRGGRNDLVLPEAVAGTVKALYPQATIQKAEEASLDFRAYEVELLQPGQGTIKVTVAPDGQAVESAVGVATESLPAAVAAALKQADSGVRIKRAAQKTVQAELQLARAAVPRTAYDVECVSGGRKKIITVAADGTLIEQKIVGHAEHKEKHGRERRGDRDDD